MKRPTFESLVSRLYILKFVQARPATVLALADRLREQGIEKNIRSLRPILRSLMITRAITAELVEGSGRVYRITESGRNELENTLSHFGMLHGDDGEAGNRS